MQRTTVPSGAVAIAQTPVAYRGKKMVAKVRRTYSRPNATARSRGLCSLLSLRYNDAGDRDIAQLRR